MSTLSKLTCLCAVSLLLTCCSHKRARQPVSKLEGTWLLDRVGTGVNLGVTLHTATTVDSLGRYSCATTATSSNRVTRFTLEGTWQVKDGYLIDTLTKHSDPTFVVPWTVRARIVRLTDQELAIHDEEHSVEAVFRRAKE